MAMIVDMEFVEPGDPRYAFTAELVAPKVIAVTLYRWGRPEQSTEIFVEDPAEIAYDAHTAAVRLMEEVEG